MSHIEDEERAFARLVQKNGWSGRRTVGAARKVFFQMTRELRRLAGVNQRLRLQLAIRMVEDEARPKEVPGKPGAGSGALPAVPAPEDPGQ